MRKVVRHAGGRTINPLEASAVISGGLAVAAMSASWPNRLPNPLPPDHAADDVAPLLRLLWLFWTGQMSIASFDSEATLNFSLLTTPVSRRTPPHPLIPPTTWFDQGQLKTALPMIRKSSQQKPAKAFTCNTS